MLRRVYLRPVVSDILDEIYETNLRKNDGPYSGRVSGMLHLTDGLSSMEPYIQYQQEEQDVRIRSLYDMHDSGLYVL